MAVLASWITCIFTLYSPNICSITCRLTGILDVGETKSYNTNTLKHPLVLINSLRDGLHIIFS